MRVAVGRKAAPADGAAAMRDARDRMQMAGDLAVARRSAHGGTSSAPIVKRRVERAADAAAGSGS